MRRLLLTPLLLILAACPQPEEPTEAAPAGFERPEGDLVIWADGTRAPLLRPFAEEFSAERDVEVVIQEVGFASIRERLIAAAPLERGPDIVVGAHDWLGELVEAGALAPVPLEGLEEDLVPLAVEAFTVDGTTYGLPYAIENPALVYNTEVAEAPSSWDDLVTTALDLIEAGTVETGLVLPAGLTDPYHNYPVVTGYDGYLFGGEAHDYDRNDVGLDSPGTVAAATSMQEWIEAGLVDADLTSDLMTERFVGGEAAYAITGPWDLPMLDEAGLPYDVAPFPEIDGAAPEPFVGVQGFMISAFAEDGLLTQAFVLETIAAAEVQLALFEEGRRPPALQSVREQVAGDPYVTAFQEAGEAGQLMPAFPEMAQVWDAWETAYERIYLEEEDAEEALTEAAETIRGLFAE